MLYTILIYLPLLFVIWIPIAIYYWALHQSEYWKRRNIPHIFAVPLLGSMTKVFSFKCCVADQLKEFYFDKKTKDEPFIGIHSFYKSCILLREPELIKRVLVTDFSSFYNRHSRSDVHSDALGSNNLVFLPNPAWKHMRARLTPTFTSGRMKEMFYLMNNIGKEFNTVLMASEVNRDTNSFECEMKEICARFTTDVIASCAFGVTANSLRNPDTDFRRHGRQMFEFSWYRSIEFSSIMFLPEIVPYFRFKLFTAAASTFLRDTIKYVMSEREKSNEIRNDLIDTLIKLRNEDRKVLSRDKTDIVFDGDVLVAQAAIFFSAGFETSSAVLSFGLYELSFKPQMQERLRKEIRNIFVSSKDEITYEHLQKMPYLDMVVEEILRMYPPLVFLDRICTKDGGYSLAPYSNYVIPKGMPIFVPIYAIQRDPKFFPNPEEFDPERFAPENKQNITPFSYIPFGTGPHNCIGSRFGLMQTKIGFIHFFKNHLVRPSENTPKPPMKLDPKALFIQAESKVNLNIFRDPIVF